MTHSRLAAWAMSCLLFGVLGGLVSAKPAHPLRPQTHASAARPTHPVRAVSGTETFTFVAYGDTRSDPEAHRAVIREIVGLHPEFVLQSGDLVARGTSADEWKEFDQITQPLHQAKIAYYPARGNHDLGSFYPLHVTEPFDSGNKYYYAFTRHHNRFIIVDSMDPEQYAPNSAQYLWLKNELSKARLTAVNTFVMFHESPFSVGPHGPTPEARQYLHPLFVQYKPRAVFCGHDHLYYRTKRDGVVYIVTGGGGAPLYQPDNKDLAIPGDVYVSEHHAILLHVDGPRVTGTVITPEGKVLDRFTLGPP